MQQLYMQGTCTIYNKFKQSKCPAMETLFNYGVLTQ